MIVRKNDHSPSYLLNCVSAHPSLEVFLPGAYDSSNMAVLLGRLVMVKYYSLVLKRGSGCCAVDDLLHSNLNFVFRLRKLRNLFSECMAH